MFVKRHVAFGAVLLISVFAIYSWLRQKVNEHVADHAGDEQHWDKLAPGQQPFPKPPAGRNRSIFGRPSNNAVHHDISLNDLASSTPAETEESDIENCAPELLALVESFLKPFIDANDGAKGIEKWMIDAAVNLTLEPAPSASSVFLIQCIENVIYVSENAHGRQDPAVKERLEAFLQMLAEYVGAKAKIAASGILPNFEFVVNFGDCPVTGEHPRQQQQQQQQHSGAIEYAKLPIMAVTRCAGSHSIPIAQWQASKDGPLHEWDAKMQKLHIAALSNVWRNRQSKAFFQGDFYPVSSFDEAGEQRTTLIDATNWAKLGRSKLAAFAMQNKNLFKCSLAGTAEYADIFDESVAAGGRRGLPAVQPRGARQPLSWLIGRYKYFLSAEAVCGWDGGLRELLFTNSLVLKQETGCQEYYSFLLQPYVHYVPVDGAFSALPDRIVWAKENGRAVRRLSWNSLMLARRLLSASSINCYMHALLARYVQAVKYAVGRRANVRVYGDVRLEEMAADL